MNEYGLVLVNGLTSGATYALSGAAFGLIFFVTGRFHFAYGLLYSASAVVAAWGVQIHGWSVPVAVVVGLAVSVVGGLLIEVVVYRMLDRRAGGLSLLGVFIASLGVVIAGEALMQLVFDQAPSYNLSLVPTTIYDVAGLYVSGLKLVTFVVCWALLVLVWLTVDRSALGRRMRAVEVNRDLAEVFGIRVGRVVLIVFAIGSALGGLLGILQASAQSATPQMGDAAIIYALVVAFLARGHNLLWYGVVGTALGLLEALIGYWFGQLQQTLVVFIVLFVYIAAAPVLGFVRSRRVRVRASATA